MYIWYQWNTKQFNCRTKSKIVTKFKCILNMNIIMDAIDHMLVVSQSWEKSSKDIENFSFTCQMWLHSIFIICIKQSKKEDIRWLRINAAAILQNVQLQNTWKIWTQFSKNIHPTKEKPNKESIYYKHKIQTKWEYTK